MKNLRYGNLDLIYVGPSDPVLPSEGTCQLSFYSKGMLVPQTKRSRRQDVKGEIKAFKAPTECLLITSGTKDQLDRYLVEGSNHHALPVK